MDKESSDSDEEAVAARQQRRLLRAQKEERQAAEEQEAKLAAAKAKEALADKERLLATLCPKDKGSNVIIFMTTSKGPRPEDFEERLATALELWKWAKNKFQRDELVPAIMLWHCAIYCVDFTPRQLASQTDATAEMRVNELLAPVLSNLTIAQRRKGDLDAARRAADLGLEAAQALPYSESKSVRIKLRFNRALLRGDQREFEGAKEDALHVLQLDPEHEEARRVAKNCDVAIRREEGPEEKRWRGSLNIELARPKKAEAWWNDSRFILGSLLVAALAVGAAQWLLEPHAPPE